MAPVRDWNADAYHRVSGPQVAWAEAILDRLELGGHETVLDAGCGSGRVTRLLLDRLPRGRVIAVDDSAGMVAKARSELADDARADVREADLATLRLADGEVLDAIFSNAVFHWIADHDALFAALAAALRPGGRISAQCGGAGNVAAVHDATLQAAQDANLANRFGGWHPWNFAGPIQTEARLRNAGFDCARCWLEPWPIVPDEPRSYLETVCIGPYLERLDPADHEHFLDAVMAHLGERPALDYVRLNIVARRAASAAS
jgi:trans-aconitate 2-methyltransferase